MVSQTGQADQAVRTYRQNTPVAHGTKLASLGALEAEFLGCIVILALMMFTGTSDYSTKMLTVMKRGTFVCIIFFILSLMAAISTNMGRVAKAFGALITIAILLSASSESVFSTLDNFFQGDWKDTSGDTSAAGQAVPGSSAASSAANSAEQKAESAGSAAEGALKRITDILSLPGFGFIT